MESANDACTMARHDQERRCRVAGIDVSAEVIETEDIVGSARKQNISMRFDEGEWG